MGPYHVSLLRMLVKSHYPVRLSSLVRGFPDSTEDYVLGAVSDLIKRGFVVRAADYVSLVESRRREALQIVETAVTGIKDSRALSDPVRDGLGIERRRSAPILAVLRPRILLVASLIVMAIVSAAGSALQSTASDVKFVSYSGQPIEEHWVPVNSPGDARTLVSGHSNAIYILHDCHGELPHTLSD